jgi:hypothetical protein
MLRAMPHRHSIVSGAAFAVLAAAGCATSAANNEHGPTFGPEGGSDVTQGETGSPDEGSPETGGGDGGHETGPGVDAGMDAASEATGMEAGAEAGSDAPPAETGGEGGFVAPTCDGTISPGEYGTIANEQTNTGTGQIWYMTWDSTNLYVAIDKATVTEGGVLYVALSPGDAGSGGLTSGYAYDGTDITSLPFAASLVVYAKSTYNEARVVTGGVWGAANTTTVKVCAGTSSVTREEVIPWSLVGGLPGSFGWLGYLAAANNPQGYIYGQMPADDPGGGPANAETYTRYYAVPNATPGVDTPFADEK